MTRIRPLAARITKTLGLALLAVAVVIWVTLGPASAAVSDRTVDALASEIMRGLNTADFEAVPAGSGYAQPTIAIKAFADEGGPVDAADANYINDRLMMALQRQARGRFRFVARDAVGDLIADMDATTDPGVARDARLRDLQANLRADILIRGTIHQTGRGPVLSYQAVASETGVLFATTTPVTISNPVPTPVRFGDVRTVQESTGPATFDRHPTVLEAERMLADLGYDPGPVDGVLTAQTRDALRDYQGDSALPVNGRMTWRVVENMRRDTR